MNGARGAGLTAMCLLVAAACRGTQEDVAAVIGSPTAVAREARLEKALADHETGIAREAPLAQWVLPRALQEISGVALTGDGRLLVHGDELGQIWEVDYRRGVLVKRFALGNGLVKGDFEGITVANDVVFLLASNGKLYEFPEGVDGANVAFTVHDTGLKAECEFEGVAFDPALNALLLACKHVHDKDLQDALVIYRWSLKSDSGSRLSRLTVPLAGVIGANGWKHVHPSDISIDPLTGNYVLVASEEKALVSITPAGAVVFAHPLPGLHRQPEGVAITKDSILIVSDEGGQGRAAITLYRWP
jgi:uncharacterized protein YjiK